MESGSDDMEKVREVSCPSRHRTIRFIDVLKGGQCSGCKTKLRLPKAHFRVPRIAGMLLGIVFVVKTYSLVFTSPASFPLVMGWLAVVVVVNLSAQLLFML